MDTRIYVVTNTETGHKTLVDAQTPAQAIRHCVRKHYEAVVGSGKTIAFYMGEGLKVEKAIHTDQPHPYSLKDQVREAPEIVTQHTPTNTQGDTHERKNLQIQYAELHG